MGLDSGTPSPMSVPSAEIRRGRVSLWLGLLGIPSFGLTAVAGLGLGLSGLRGAHRGWSIAGVLVSFVVIAGWMGGLAGVIEVMRTAQEKPGSIWSSGERLGTILARKVVLSVDPAAPRPPSDQELARLLDALPEQYRRFDVPPVPLAIEPLKMIPGVLLRWRIGAPLDPESGSTVTDVDPDPDRSGIFLFAADGRSVLPFRLALDPQRRIYDDPATTILELTGPAARAIVAAAQSASGELPDAIEAGRIIAATGIVPRPMYRLRPGGLFDLIDPRTRIHATYAAFGGVLVPVIP